MSKAAPARRRGPLAAQSPGPERRGAAKFVLLHHDVCEGGRFHYRISPTGAVEPLLDEEQRGQHPFSIGVAVAGNFDETIPSDVQIEALQDLLLRLKRRYPAVELGAHRQVRGSAETTCPGRRFPMKNLAAWWREEMPRARDAAFTREFEEQYSKI